MMKINEVLYVIADVNSKNIIVKSFQTLKISHSLRELARKLKVQKHDMTKAGLKFLIK